MMALEVLTVIAGLHQLDEADADPPRAQERQPARQFIIVQSTQQHGIELDRLERQAQGFFNALHHRLKAVMPGDGVEAAAVQAVDADIDRSQTGGLPLRDFARKQNAVGGHRNGLQARHTGRIGNDVGQVTAQAGLAAGQTQFPQAHGGERAQQPGDFLPVEPTGLSFTRPEPIGQAIAAMEIAGLQQGKPQVRELPAETVGQYSHVFTPFQTREAAAFLSAGWPKKCSRLPCLERSEYMAVLTDRFGRQFPYLRLSLLEACNFHCSYCLPNGFRAREGQSRWLSREEITRLLRAFTAVGLRKLRLTGGEPSLRSDLTDIIADAARMPGLQTIAMTTNGILLPRKIAEWQAAGLTAINVSVDSLDRSRFHAITGHDRFETVMEGVEKALCLPFKAVKLNAVLLRGLNDDELPGWLAFLRTRRISIRFIELNADRR